MQIGRFGSALVVGWVATQLTLLPLPSPNRRALVTRSVTATLDMDKRQQALFEREPAPWEFDAQAERLLASVVFAETPHGPFD